MIITVNSFVREYLQEHKVQGTWENGAICIYKDGDILHIPDDGGYMEEYSSINGNILCPIGNTSYSISSLRLDVKIARYCSIAAGLDFIKSKHPLDLISTSAFTYDNIFYICKDANTDLCNGEFQAHNYNLFIPPSKPTIIENDVYICTNALLKPGIKLHTGCVVAERAVVTKDVPPYAIVGGMPAKIIKYRFDEKTIKRLLKLEWWKYHFTDFKNIDLFSDINYYLDELEKRIQNKQIKPFNPKKMFFKELEQRSKQSKTVLVQGLKENESAVSRVKNHLSFKLGEIILENSNSFISYIKIAFVLEYVVKNHNTKTEPHKQELQNYKDYNETLNIKQGLVYNIGNEFIKHMNRGGGDYTKSFLVFLLFI